MGWSAGNEVFDPVARKVRELGLTDGQVTEILVVLIRELQDRDWDTEGESLDLFEDDEAIVEAFRRQEITQVCNAQDGEGAAIRWCERERGEKFHRDGRHGDGEVTWPVTA